MNETELATKRPFRILSLDGGGIRGVISARILQEVEKAIREQCNGQSLTEYFDMIAGTSTGSLIAAAVAVGYSPSTLVDIYQNEGTKIFPYQKLMDPRRWKLLLQNGPSAPKFSNEGLIGVIQGLEKFKKGGEYIKLRDVGRESPEQAVPNPILVIPAFDTKYRNTTVFTNYRPSDKKKWYLEQPLWKICLSSASAPTFFPPCEFTNTEANGEEWSFPHVDGGVTANNPALCAISRAIELGHKLENIQLLSIGTGQNKNPMEFNEIKGWGLVQWGLHISDVFMEGQAEVQGNICLNLLGGFKSNRYLRLQFDLNKAFGEAPNYLARAPILRPAERVNTWLKKHLSEAMDDARNDSVEALLEATNGYLESGNVYDSRFQHYGPVKENIKQFVLGSTEDRACCQKQA
ncbi:patatin-like phospholipase family protein [Candidatus Methylospira mobilis]|uniref:Patatin-like phospholipase family protein n=1 Tax=Candidatus Methylospira mobilis TaxID=1808979 RepID=A0A5Q0BK33_9GAMM|nr:patatin-like phospholipase family protein [Candidatus Methylospira mobilis]QFY42527.1 patatin-like phospholipase family protein [Candidatus Methylospira mobilis]WNV04366.1 patatin-like phospholipase family protein [Candidatus Methylospira mobilis]